MCFVLSPDFTDENSFTIYLHLHSHRGKDKDPEWTTECVVLVKLHKLFLPHRKYVQLKAKGDVDHCALFLPTAMKSGNNRGRQMNNITVRLL